MATAPLALVVLVTAVAPVSPGPGGLPDGQGTARPKANPPAGLHPALDELLTLPEGAEAWVGREDLVGGLQAVAAGGVATLVGGLVLGPGLVGLTGAALLAVALGAPVVALAAPLAVLPGVVVAQGLAAGVTVWLLSLVGGPFEARAYAPAWLERLARERAGLDSSRGWGRALVGAPWLTGFAGYLVGAVLGGVAGAAVGLPMVAAALLLFTTPWGNLAGASALVLALAVTLTVTLVAETLVAPLTAAAAHHLTKTVAPAPR
jgi:hypothetical protein